ncbi:hypothetical protein V6U71_12745 [Sphingopyxis sp. J-6]|uniref:hypothetical protein n=1 Tax=Sphingopyxis sp. J-6 TaxID=3122054 RepID=UPI0039842F69
MRLRHYLKLLPLLLLIPAAAADARLTGNAGAQAPSIPVPPLRESWRYRCDAERVLAGGTVSLTRLYTDAGKLDGGDFMRWTPAAYDPQRPQRPLDLELSYIWDPARQPAIEPRAIEVKLRVGIDADLPEVALIWMQRPFPVEPHGIIGSTALSTQIFPYAAYDMRNGHGELPLGDLLAYAEGYDALGWTLVRPSDRLGGDAELARGTIDIAALREAVATLPALRTMLAAKTAEPKTRCERVLWPEHILY